MLSKSQFIRGRQCHKSLWLHRHRPELRDETTDAQEAIFASGTDVGQLAQQLFPGGIEFAYDDGTLSEQLKRTAEAIVSGVTTLYEATFEYGGVLVKTDILHRGANGWELYEVKSSTKLKEVYLDDIAVQLYVLRGCGLTVAQASLIHINTEYVRQGEIDVQSLFTRLDVTTEAEARQTDVVAAIAEQMQLLAGPEPVIDIGPHCDDPYTCDFSGHCWAHIPSPSVFDLRDHGKPDAFALYRQGIVRLEDVPADQLGWRQKLQVAGTLRQENRIDTGAIRDFLGELTYPISYLDFESTYMVPVPLYDRSHPYQQIVFQYSLHIQDVPDGPVRHHAFLAEADQSDPRPAFIATLLQHLPESGSIVAFNQVFEIGRLNELIADFPELAAGLAALPERFVDLMAPFRRKEIYLWPLHGSYSIKSVLPALVPELSYATLAIGNGSDAAQGWLELLAGTDSAAAARLRQDMLDYCHLDTWGMVRIVDKLREMTNHVAADG
ncbi:MAG: hypothetical protein A2091_01855 [Desulfuromonadales bacterium GWD2_61_12]|nr:MAG: hypothetical protein A2005_06040 [Desulfuromonadales bacterium GWC2_61_20]OGR35725.1 MAG: hypothetical protein A2091_01855 [Desulfuromonadales bacterium GWD2_61_12]HAD04406.1 DUF2779 domain-containing protein [Desulfuromonas sp.]HBT82956.1 DUF2779 domain-containing protein [Desulfuromonas sp.]